MSNVNLQDWVGRKEEIRDRVYPTPAKAFALTLDYRDFMAREGDPLPELWHWLYFLPLVARAEIGPDGHPRRGGFLPPVALERRMWASGKLTFHQDLFIGEEIGKTSEILNVSEKEGKAGRMVFVTVRHSIHSARESRSRKNRISFICRCPKLSSRQHPTRFPRICNGRRRIPSTRYCCSGSPP